MSILTPAERMAADPQLTEDAIAGMLRDGRPETRAELLERNQVDLVRSPQLRAQIVVRALTSSSSVVRRDAQAAYANALPASDRRAREIVITPETAQQRSERARRQEAELRSERQQREEQRAARAAGLLNALRALLLTGWIRARQVADPTRRERNSEGGRAAVRTLRSLWVLLGNAATRDMVAAGYADLLFLLSSPAWLDSRVSQKAIRAATAFRGRRDEWAAPFGPDDGQDVGLKGTPGGEARAAVKIWLDAGAPFERASFDTTNSDAWAGLAQAYETWPQRAADVIAGLESFIAAGGRVPDRAAAEAAIWAEYGAELRFLATDDGQRLLAANGIRADRLLADDDRLTYVRAEVPSKGTADAAAALADALNARGPGNARIIKRPGVVEWPLRDEADRRPGDLADLGDLLPGSNAQEGTPADAPAPETPEPKKTTKTNTGAAKVAIGVTGALGVLGLIMKLRGR